MISLQHDQPVHCFGLMGSKLVSEHGLKRQLKVSAAQSEICSL